MDKFDDYILISDIDGTLTDDNGKISSKNIKAIEYFRNNGGIFTVATGRTMLRTKFLSEYLTLDLPGIFCNGAVIADLNTDKVLWKKSINNCVKEVLKDYHLKNKESCIIAFTENKDYFINPGKFIKLGYNINGFNYCEGNVSDIVEPVYKAVIISNDDVIDLLSSEYSDYLDRIYFTKSNTYIYEIMDKNINKGNAVDNLKNILKLENKKVITIGDNLNDMEFIKTADIGVAVLNGCHELIKMADITVEKDDALCNLISKL